MKYLVMECHAGYIVVMDEEGRFLKAVNRHYEVGQLLPEITPMAASRQKKQPWLYALTALAACLVLLFTMALPTAPYASVYVKINPEIRIDVDKNDRVLALEGINADGVALMQDYDYHKKDLKAVTEELVDLAITAGFLQADGQITLTLDSADELWVTNHKQALSDHMYTHLQGHFTCTIEVSTHHEGHHSERPTELPQDIPAALDDRNHHENGQADNPVNEHYSSHHSSH